MTVSAPRKTRRIPVTARTIKATSPGEPVIIDGAQVATIWSDGPRPSTVWALSPDGEARVYKRHSTETSEFIDLQETAPARSPQWQTLLDLAIAGRGVYVTRIQERAGYTSAFKRDETIVHAHACDLIPEDDHHDGLTSFTTPMFGVHMLTWLHCKATVLGGGFHAPTLESVLAAQWCECTGHATVAVPLAA